MPRHSYKKPRFELDPVYKTIEVTKLINHLTIGGKKSVARTIVYNVIERFNKEKQDGLKVLNTAIANVAPNFEVKPRRLGGASYLVPTEVRPERKLFLSLNWIIDATRARSNKEFHKFEDKLYTELKEASQNQGAAIAKKLQVEKLAEANRAFAHLKW